MKFTAVVTSITLLSSVSVAGTGMGYDDYPRLYMFGEDGDEVHPDGWDGFPGDTPPGTPGAP